MAVSEDSGFDQYCQSSKEGIFEITNLFSLYFND